jgi:hypothetical protein
VQLAATSRSAVLGLQVDANDEVLRSGLTYDLSIATSSGVLEDDLLKVLLRIFIDDACCAAAPSAPGIHPDPWLCLDVVYVVRSPAMLGHDPEHIAVESVGHGCNPSYSALPANRLDQRSTTAANPQANGGTGNPIDQPHQ